MRKEEKFSKIKYVWTMKSQVEYHQMEERNSGQCRARDLNLGPMVYEASTLSIEPFG